MNYLLLALFLYWIVAVIYYANKRPSYSHFKHTISELGESGSIHEKLVGFRVFAPIGLAFLLLAYLVYAKHQSAAVLSFAMGMSYFLSAFFPCDPGTPVSGSWKNTIHNLVGGIAYVAMGYQLKELIDQQLGWYVELAFIALAVFLFNFIIGWPKQIVGLTQRVAESAVFMCIFMLLNDGTFNFI
ncbi:MAG: DUF998 domain-containing protein [Marinicella sp.]